MQHCNARGVLEYDRDLSDYKGINKICLLFSYFVCWRYSTVALDPERNAKQAFFVLTITICIWFGMDMILISYFMYIVFSFNKQY